MTVETWVAPIKIRTFRVVYQPDPEGKKLAGDIPLGLFGDLRMGERYALGLIARSGVTPEELKGVGQLARPLVSAPYKSLRSYYEAIWETDHRADAFEEAMREPYSSVRALEPSCIEDRVSSQEIHAEGYTNQLDDVRNWCMDRLRRELRRAYEAWITRGPAVDMPREQVDEAEIDISAAA